VRARQRAAAADVVIVNHHLFFADLALRERDKAELLPDYMPLSLMRRIIWKKLRAISLA
jgi:Rad3-related DNA helicase